MFDSVGSLLLQSRSAAQDVSSISYLRYGTVSKDELCGACRDTTHTVGFSSEDRIIALYLTTRRHLLTVVDNHKHGHKL